MLPVRGEARAPAAGEPEALVLLETVANPLGLSASARPLLPRPVAPAPASDAGAGRALRVLLVEDDVTNQLVVSRLLGRLGHQTEIAADGRAALEAFDRAGGRFDLVVTDLQMPHMDGTELIEQLRARVPALPIIVLTAHTMDASDDWLAMTRADCCVSKPLSIAELVAALDSLGLSRGPREPPRAGEVAWGPITTRQRERLPGLTSRGLARPRAR